MYLFLIFHSAPDTTFRFDRPFIPFRHFLSRFFLASHTPFHMISITRTTIIPSSHLTCFRSWTFKRHISPKIEHIQIYDDFSNNKYKITTYYTVNSLVRRVELDWHRPINLYRVCQKTDLLTCNGIRCCSDLFLPFLNEHRIISRMPLRKLRLKNAYSSGLMAELQYDMRNVVGVRRALKFDSPW